MRRRNLTNHYLKLISLQSYQHSGIDIFVLCIIIYFLIISIMFIIVYSFSKKKHCMKTSVLATMFLYHTYRLVLTRDKGVCHVVYVDEAEPLNNYYFNVILSTIIYLDIILCLIYKCSIINKFLIYTFFFKYSIIFQYLYNPCCRLKFLYDPYGDVTDLVHATNFTLVYSNTKLIDTYIVFIVLVSIFILTSELLDNLILVPNTYFVLFPTLFVLIYFINKNIIIYESISFYSTPDLYLLVACIYIFTNFLLER
ncbi:protein E7B [Elephant endotheliotropic herpesvirus 3B]|nr:protein E7B [Elephant endotheliotropic herpesvirus 3B]